MLITDSVRMEKPRRTKDGYLVVDAAIARTGIQVYGARELGMAGRDSIRLYRPEATVFDADSMASATHKTVTNDHPPEDVSAANWRKYSVGMTGDTAVRDGDHIRVPFTVMDAETIAAIDDGKRELSAGYAAKVDFTAGLTDAGEPYDAIVTDIRFNHLAIVDRGRAGPTCRIGDSWNTPQLKEAPTMPTEAMRTVLVDGLSVQTTDEGAQAIEKLQRQLADAAQAATGKDGQIAALQDGHTRALAGKDGELTALRDAHQGALAAKDGEIAALTARIPDAAAMDALIDVRLATLGTARKVLGDSFDGRGKSDADIRRAMVEKRLGDKAAGKPDEWVSAAFETLAMSDATAPAADPLRSVLTAGVQTQATVTDAAATARNDYLTSLQDGWKNPKGAV